ncbi:MAG TPA: serine hydrolase domain-containing protein [Sphingomicrobium sp.]|nr:serine hydrolase domain-containing protein [Sphingomicrobium sp.]
MLRFAPALLALLALPAFAQPISTAELAQIDQAVAKALADTSVPSASIAIVRDGKIVLAKAYGTANDGLPARPDLPYQIASNSKQFTAMALLLLEDEGRLSLDDRVSKYLPGISGGERITLRQLLNHTSGLQDYWPQDYSFEAMSRPTSPQGIVDRWAKKPLDFQPGEQWQYSNTGYVVAGMIAEKVSGERLMAYLKRRIFDPLGMSSVRDQDDTNSVAFPSGYGRYALGPVRKVTPPGRGWLYAAGELSMTAEDLAKWDIARLDRSLVPADDWVAQETTAKLTDGKDTNYGLGVFVRESGGRRAITHGGESVGFLSANNVYPAERAAIVVMTNSWSGNAYSRIVRDVAKIVLPAPPAAVGEAVQAAQAKRARTVYDQLRSGRLDRSLLTGNANYYFTPQAIADFRSSLGPLGEPTGFEASGPPVLRGGFVIQGYTVKYPGRTLNLSTFYEPGANGRIEQFLVSPGE